MSNAANSIFIEKVGLISSLFERLSTSEPFLEKGSSKHKGLKGVYSFFEEGAAVHVGRTRNLQRRLRGHTAFSHYSASFAFKEARRRLGIIASYTSKNSRSELQRDSVFGDEFKRQIARVKAMHVRFIVVEDPIEQYLLELYAHLEFGLPLDEFDTH